MLPDTDDAAIQADAYIDALLTGHRRAPVGMPADSDVAGPLGRQPGVPDAIRLLEEGLPRFHPSFLFEEWLAGQLRRQAAGEAGAQTGGAHVIPIAVIRSTSTAAGRLQDRRLLVGGAIASGVSIAGAAVYAWRRSRT